MERKPQPISPGEVIVSKLPLRAAFVASVASYLGLPAGAQVQILGKPGSYPTIQGAVDAATDGDVLTVENGSYPSFSIDGKSLTVQARNQGLAIVNGLSGVKNIPSQKSVALVGLKLQATNQSFLPPDALTLRDSSGGIRVQGCVLHGAKYGSFPFSTDPAGHALRTVNCARVLIVQSTLLGADYGSVFGEEPRMGGDGLRSDASGVFVYQSQLQGGTGSEESNPQGGSGGAGARLTGWGLFASGSTFLGGQGGGGDYIGCGISGDGGAGLVLVSNQAKLLDNTYQGGLPGFFGPCGHGEPGKPIDATNAVIQEIPLAARDLVGPAEVNDNSSTTFTVAGNPGDSVWLLRSQRSSWMFVTSLNGLTCIPLPWKLPALPAGVIGISGTHQVPLVIPDLQGLDAGWTFEVQAICVEPDGSSVLSSPLQVLVINT